MAVTFSAVALMYCEETFPLTLPVKLPINCVIGVVTFTLTPELGLYILPVIDPVTLPVTLPVNVPLTVPINAPVTVPTILVLIVGVEILLLKVIPGFTTEIPDIAGDGLKARSPLIVAITVLPYVNLIML